MHIDPSENVFNYIIWFGGVIVICWFTSELWAFCWNPVYPTPFSNRQHALTRCARTPNSAELAPTTPGSGGSKWKDTRKPDTRNQWGIFFKKANKQLIETKQTKQINQIKPVKVTQCCRPSGVSLMRAAKRGSLCAVSQVRFHKCGLRRSICEVRSPTREYNII